jgi:hypothetical protein
MYVETVPNRSSPPAILLRESWREDGKIHKRTLLNLSTWDPAHVEGLRAVLKGGTVIPPGQDAIRIERTLPHGHVAAALGTARRSGLDRLLGPAGNRCRDLVLALIVSRILDPVLSALTPNMTTRAARRVQATRLPGLRAQQWRDEGEAGDGGWRRHTGCGGCKGGGGCEAHRSFDRSAPRMRSS